MFGICQDGSQRGDKNDRWLEWNSGQRLILKMEILVVLFLHNGREKQSFNVWVSHGADSLHMLSIDCWISIAENNVYEPPFNLNMRAEL